MVPTRWYILMGLTAWVLSCVLVFFLAFDVALSRAMMTRETDARSAEGMRQPEATPLPTGGSRRSNIAKPLAEDTLGESPLRRLEVATGLHNGEIELIAMRGIAAGFSLRDVRQVLPDIRRMTPGPMRDRMMRATLGRWAELEPEAAVAFALNESNYRLRNAYLDAAFSAWVAVDPTAAMAHAETLMYSGNNDVVMHDIRTTDRPDALMLHVRQAVQALNLEEIPGALDALAALRPGPKRRMALLAVIGRWAQLSPADAAVYAEAETAPILRRKMIDAVIGGWALQNPTDALAYLESHGARPSSRGLSDGIARLPFGDAVAFLETLDRGRHTGLFLSALGQLWNLEPSGSRAWAKGLPPGSLREKALEGIGLAWAKYEPEAARDWMIANCDEGTLSRRLPVLAGKWASQAPEAALAWYLNLSDGESASRIGESVFGSWLMLDPEEAATYLNSAEPSPRLDPGFEKYAYFYSSIGRDPLGALAVAGKILDDQRRATTISNVVRSWSNQDPEAALVYLETSALPADEREALENLARKRLQRSKQ